MAEVVDSIISELILRNVDQYEAGFNRATEAHGRFKSSVDKLKAQTFDLSAEAGKYKAGGDAIGQAEEQTTTRILRARKARTDGIKTAATAEVSAEKQAAAERRSILEQAARDEDRLREQALANARRSRAQTVRDARSTTSLTPTAPAVDLFRDYDAQVAARRASRGGASLGGVSEAGDRSAVARQTEQARQVRVEAEQTVVAEKEINAAMVEQIRLQAGLASARGEDRRLIREQIADMRTYNQLIKTGLTEEAAAIELDRIRVARSKELAAQEAAQARSGADKNLLRFGEGAGLGRAYGSAATVAGIAVAAGAGAAVAAVSSSIDYAKDIKNTAEAVGLTTKQVQIYSAAARDAGVSSEQFRSAIGQLNGYIGKAKEGDQEAAKTFAALGVNLKNVSSAGDALPTLIDRLSKIGDPAQRAAIETRLFGEEGRRLDAVLSGGNGKINELAAALERTGAILSSGDIAKLDDTAKKLEQVKAQLQVDLAQVVAGNADSIKSLADAFKALADDILGAVKAYDRFTTSHASQQAAQESPVNLGKRVSNAIDRTGVPSAVNRFLGLSDPAAKTIADDQEAAIGKGLAGVDNAFSVQRGNPDSKAIASLFAPKPPKGPKGKSADTLEAEAEQRTKRYNDQLAGYQEQQLRAEEDATGSIQERASLESQLAERQRNRQIADINSQEKINVKRGANPELEEARAKILRDAVTQATATSETNREAQVERDLRSQENQHLQTRLSIESDLLATAEPLARTAADRLAIQLRILDLEKQQEKAALDTQIANAKPGEDTSDLSARRGSIDQRYAGRARDAAQSNLGPLAAYANTLPRTGAEVGEEFERAAVNGIESMNSALDKSISKALKLHGLAGSIVNDFLQAGLKAAEGSLFGNLFGTGGGSGGAAGAIGGIGGLIGKIGGLFGGGAGGLGSLVGSTSSLLGASNASGFASILNTLPHLAGGGSFEVGGNGGIDRNLLSINGKGIAAVNQGERVAVIPKDIGSGNGRVSPQGHTTVVQQTINVDGRGSITPADFHAQILNEADARAQTYSKAAYNGALNGAPGRVQYVKKSEG